MRRGACLLAMITASLVCAPARSTAIALSDQCPASFEKRDGHCRLHSAYEQYASLRDAGVGGLKTGLPAFRDGFAPREIDLGRYLFFDPALSANGKVDRKRLNLLRPAVHTVVEPRDELERRLCAIWRTVLKDPEIGIQDDFFDSGGDSLLAMNLVLRVESAFKIKVTLDQVLDHFTVEEFARILRARASLRC